MPSFNSNHELIDYLVNENRIRSEEVEAAFREVNRREFIPDEQSDMSYADRPVPIKEVTVSAPHMVAEVTELLEITGKEKILEIGSGSGYQAAILAKLAEKVIGVEIDESLAEYSRKRVPKNVEIRHGNGFKAIDETFDRVLFSCATESLEEDLNHVNDDGIIVGPVREGSRQTLKKWDSGEYSEHGGVRYVEMQG